MDTTICTVCGGKGDVEVPVYRDQYETQACSYCGGSGQSPLYRAKILKRPASGGKSIAMEAAITAINEHFKREKK